MNNIFSLQRVGNLLRRQFMAGRMTLVKGVIFGVVILLVSSVFQAYGFSRMDEVESILDNYAWGMGNTCMVAFIIVIIFGPSLIVRGISNKAQRSTFMMLPASSFEKFVVRYLIVSVGFLVAVFAVFVVADVLSILINSLLFGIAFPSFTLEVFESLAELVSNVNVEPFRYVDVRISIFTVYFYLHSIALLCGVLWRRFPVVMTGLVFFVGTIFFNMLEWWRFLPTKPIYDGTMAVTLHVFAFSLSMIHFILAYRIFRRMQLAGRKWLNV